MAASLVLAAFINGFLLGGLPGNFVLRLVVKPMNPGEVAFRDQFRLGLQPVLHIVPGQRTLVHITEVGPSGHFVR